MANQFYDHALTDFAASWLSSNVIALLVDGSIYTPNRATDQFISDIPGGAILARSGNLSSKTNTAGLLDAADFTWNAVPAGSTGTYLVIAYNTGVNSTSKLQIIDDTAGGLPVTTNGGDIQVQWDNGTYKIGQL